MEEKYAPAEPATESFQASEQLDPRTTALPPILSSFKDVRELGCCLDLTCHYIVNVRFLTLVMQLPMPDRANRYPPGVLHVFHVPYRDSRIRDIFHGVFFFRKDLCLEPCKCLDHRLMDMTRRAFPAAIETQMEVTNAKEYVEALYDIRRFCPECAGLPIPPAKFAGFEYVPYEQPAISTVSDREKGASDSASPE